MTGRPPRDPDLDGPGFWSRLHAACLLLYPRPYRERYGPDMKRTFTRRLDDARMSGRSVAGLAFRELIGVPFHALRQRLRRRGGADDMSGVAGRPGRELLGKLLAELRQGVRRLLRAPGFTGASILTLGLGVGATTAIYSLVHSTVIAPLPYPDSGELVWLDHAGPGIGAERGLGMTDGLYVHYTEGSERLEDIATWLFYDVTLGGDEPERMRAALVTPSFFDAMRTPPALGRPFTEDQVRTGQGGVVIGHDLWQRRFGGRADAVGETVRIDGTAVEVTGVMPAGFAFPDRDVDLWLPLGIDPGRTGFGGFSRQGVARLAPGATRASAEAELASLLPGLPDRFGEGMVGMLEDSRLTPLLPSLKEEIVRESESTLWILLGSVAFVLLLTCANVANLLLVRAEGRHRETALRRALGAGRAELVRYFMAEGLLLSIAGGAIGIGLAAIAARLLVAHGPADLPRLAEVSISPAVVGLALVVAFVASIVFGLIPAVRRTPSLAGTIRSGDARSSEGRSSSRGRGALVATQVALALMLLVATGLMSRSFANLVAFDPGFEAEAVLTFSVGLPAARYPDRESGVAFHREAMDRLAAIPEVQSVAATTCLPLCGSWAGTQLEVQGRPPDPNTVPGVVSMRRVSDAFFETLRVRLVAGRLPDRADHDDGLPLAVISERLVDRYWPDEDPLGQRFRPGANDPWFEVVGVVENTPIRQLGEDPAPMAYLTLTGGGSAYESSSHQLFYVLRTAGPPQGALVPAREAIRSLDPAIPIADATTLEDLVARSSASTAFTMVVLAAAAGIALLLGIVGIYGVISYAVSQRAREIGIRMALGARAGQVRRSVLAKGGRMTAIGLVAGLSGAFALTRVMRGLLFGVSPTDPITFLVVPAVLMIVALAATLIPARRASRVDPMETLRAD